MAFESLSDKLSNIFKNLRGKGRLSEQDIDAALKEVRMALLEADVNFRVVKQFVGAVKERCMGSEVMNGLNPAQTVIKIVNEELTSLMGSETMELKFQPGKSITVIMMAGLQGSGKTTSAAKLAAMIKTRGKTPLLAALDVYRPAAVEQLRVNAELVKSAFYSSDDPAKMPPQIAKDAVAYAAAHGQDVVFLDTAGRLQIDEDMMQELLDIKAAVDVHQTLLVVDAMTGQEAVNIASAFQEKIGIDGVILSKMDGDTRGGAALSVKAVTGKPILYVGMGEKLSDLEQFYPDRMAGRILGMGDVLTLIDKAQAAFEQEDAQKNKERAGRVKKGKFDYNDYLESLRQMRKMGGFSSLLSLMPGMNVSKDEIEGMVDEKMFAHTEAIIYSMTPEERENPNIMTPQRKFRIAKGCGLDIAEVNRFIKQFTQAQKFMKKAPGLLGRKHGGNPFGGLPGRGRFPF